MRWLVVLVAIATACADPSAPFDACGAESDSACVELRIVAHEDDDLLFMNPDVAAGIAHGHRTITVYITAGTTGDRARAEERERGVLNAYTYLLAPDEAARDRADGDRVVATWQRTQLERGVEYARGNVALVFLGMPEDSELGDLTALWDGDVPVVASLDGWTATRSELIATLAAIIDRASASNVATLDATQLFHDRVGYGEHRVDHADHVAAARFAIAAFLVSRATRLDQYRGYDIADDVANLAAGDSLAKRRAFYRYFALGEPMVDSDGELTNRDPDDPHFRLDQYEHWSARRYAIRSVDERRGRLALGARCLHAGGLGDCAHAPGWTLAAHELRTDDGACFTLGNDPACARILITATGQIRTADASCLTGSPDGVRAASCARVEREPAIAQRWTWR